MKNKTLYSVALIMLAALFLGSCKNDIPVIKKQVTSGGVVSTIASGRYNYVTVDKSGNIYALRVNYGGTDSIFKFDASGNKTLFFTAPPTTDHDTLVTNTLTCLAADSTGNIYTVDYAGVTSANVLKISPGGSAATIATHISYPTSITVQKIAVDALGNFYFNDSNGLQIITPGGASSILLSSDAENYAVDKNGNVFYSNGQTGVQKMTVAGVKTTIAAPANILGYIYDMGADIFGNIYVSSETDAVVSIQKINTRDTLSTVISGLYGHADGPIATAKINLATSLATDASGNLYFTEISGAVPYLRKITF